VAKAVLHIVDDAEALPDAAAAWLHADDAGGVPAAIELVDRESGATLRLAPDAEVARRYAAVVADWLQRLEAACAAEAAAYARISTSCGIDDATLALLHARGVIA
jgi:hypothetical protein